MLQISSRVCLFYIEPYGRKVIKAGVLCIGPIHCFTKFGVACRYKISLKFGHLFLSHNMAMDEQTEGYVDRISL